MRRDDVFVSSRPLLVILAIALVVSGCHGTTTATCFQPSARPSRDLTPDRYGIVVTSTPGNAWLTGSARTRPSILRFADGVSVTLDSHTRRLSACSGASCSAFVGLRPRSHIADWVFGVDHRTGSTPELEQAAVWDIGDRFLVMSNGLRLGVVPTISLPTRAQLLTWGTLVSVSLNSKGAVQSITHGGCT